MALSGGLLVLGEKTLHQPADPRLLVYCPSMDLLALGGKGQQVLIYRLNGQRVYGTAQKGTALAVDRICWKPNGQLLGIAWSDGVVRLVGAESSKTVHQISTGQENSGITWLGWASNLTRRNVSYSAKPLSSRRDVVEGIQDSRLDDIKPLDLPRDLSLIDVEASVPKLSVLPTGATAEDIFSTRTSVDGIFRVFDPNDNDTVDIMVVGTQDGRVHINIYDSFKVGSFPSPLASSMMRYKPHLELHASNKLYSTYALLFAPSESNDEGPLFFVPMDLRFVYTSSGYLPMLASKSTALQNLLRYIDQVQILMGVEWEAIQDLPRKFLRNINETLAEKNNCDIIQALYHSVVTGHAFPAVREWLVDELAERGHKRWDKAVISGLENLRKLVHEDMLPALERCSIILSRLAGMVKFQGSNDAMGFSSHQINLVMDTVACMNLVCAKILVYTIEELDTFTAFSTWLRYEIDRLASDSSSSPADDIIDKESAIDHSKVLFYIQTSMTNSRLGAFFKDAKSDEDNDNWEKSQKGLPLFLFVDKALQRNEVSLSYSTLTRIDVLYQHLNRQATDVFHRIAAAEKRNVLFGHPIPLFVDSANIRKIMRVCPQDSTSCRVFIGIASVNKITMFAIDLKIENGVSKHTSITEATLQFDDSHEILDLAFTSDHTLLVLSKTDDSPPNLLTLPYQTTLKYGPFLSGSQDSRTESRHYGTQTLDAIASSTRTYSLPEGGTFTPDRITVGERTRSRVENSGPRICVLDRNRMQYRVFVIEGGLDTADACDDKEDDDDGQDVQMTQ